MSIVERVWVQMLEVSKPPAKETGKKQVQTDAGETKVLAAGRHSESKVPNMCKAQEK